MAVPADPVLGPLLDTEPGSPLVTQYDLASGARIELSAVSTANWAAKIAGLLRDEVGVHRGDTVLLDLPLHWLTPAVLLGVWWAGGRAVTTGGSASATPSAVVTVVDRLDRHDPHADALVMSTDAMGRDLSASGVDLPLGVIDLVGSCRIHPDSFSPEATGVHTLDGEDLGTLAAGVPSGRLLLVEDGSDPLPTLARGLARGASLVLITSPGDDVAVNEAAVADVSRTEKVTSRV